MICCQWTDPGILRAQELALWVVYIHSWIILSKPGINISLLASVSKDSLCLKYHDDIRMTLNNRLVTAAAAIVTRMMTFNKPRVLWPELPFRRTSTGDSAITARDKRKDEFQWGLK
jgi:hypothetical protein